MTAYRILYHHRIRADDGQAVHVRELIAALRRAGHEVAECALLPKAGGRSSAGPERPGSSSLWQWLELPRAAVEAMEIAYGALGARRLLRAAAAFRPHFLYERHALHCSAGLRAARTLGLPLVLEVNAPMCDEMERLGKLRFATRARRTERAVLGAADWVLAVTGVLRERAIECGADPARTLVIGNAAQPDRYDAETRAAGAALRQRWPADSFVLGFHGYARPWHRLDLALGAMAQPGLERVHLVVAGEGPALADLRARAAALQLGARIHTMGVVPAAELPALVSALDAALIPAINAYASPLKLFDALAAGVPVLAPDQPNLREVLRDGVDALLFHPGDGAALASGLRALATDPARARALGAAGRARLIERDWTWDGNARRVIAAFEAMVP